MSKVFVVRRRVTYYIDDRNDSFQEIINVCRTEEAAIAVITDYVERRKNHFPSDSTAKWNGQSCMIQGPLEQWCLWIVETFVE